MKQHCLVYKITNIKTGQYYIGAHVTSDIDDGYMGSGKRIRRAVAKHGSQMFSREILEFCENADDMYKKEAALVTQDALEDSLCMNLREGGKGGWRVNKEIRAKIYSSKLQAQRSPMNDPVWLAKNKANLLKWRAEALVMAQRKLTEMRLDGWVSPGMIGKHHTEKSKNKMSRSMQGKQDGKKNSQYGTCWIYSLEQKRSMKIKNDSIEKWLQKGWKKGRKFKF